MSTRRPRSTLHQPTAQSTPYVRPLGQPSNGPQSISTLRNALAQEQQSDRAFQDRFNHQTNAAFTLGDLFVQQEQRDRTRQSAFARQREELLNQAAQAAATLQSLSSIWEFVDEEPVQIIPRPRSLNTVHPIVRFYPEYFGGARVTPLSDGTYLISRRGVGESPDHPYNPVHSIPPPISVTELLDIYKFNGPSDVEDKNDCPICLEENGAPKQVPQVRFFCLHRMHTKCASKWFETSASCPVCRAVLSIS